jgi:phospholipid/cholesterol/gamma-HCH transport system substrate-binding protein
VNALAKNDTTVRHFNDSLASASDLLKDERGDLRASLHNLGIAMQAVQGFVRENRGTLSHNIKGLNRVSKVLVKQRAAIDQILRIAPTALANLFHTYNPAAGTLDTRTNMNETVSGITADPAKFLCGILKQGAASKGQSASACKALGALPKPRAGALTPTSGDSSGTRQVELVDRSLGGILGGQR